MKNLVNRSSSTSTYDDPLKVWCQRMSNLRRPISIQVIYGVDVFHPTSTYLILKSTCELIGVDVSSSKLYLWTYLRRRIFSQCPPMSSNTSTFIYPLECITSTYIATVSMYILLIPYRVSTYLSCTSTCIIYFHICADVCKNQCRRSSKENFSCVDVLRLYVDLYPIIRKYVSTLLVPVLT